MKKYFVTSTGTNVGKTLVTSAIASQLLKKSKKVKAIKPIISGFDTLKAATSDTGYLLRAQGLPVTEHHVAEVSPWRYTAALSPDQAAAEEGGHIDFDELVSFSKQPSHDDYLLVEGVGGVMTPLDESHTVLDWMASLGYPAILVAGNYLGSLSHTLAAAHVITSRGLPLRAVIINEVQISPISPQQTRATLKRFLPHDTSLYVIGKLDSAQELWKHAPDLTSIIL